MNSPTIDRAKEVLKDWGWRDGGGGLWMFVLDTASAMLALAVLAWVLVSAWMRL